MRIVKAMPRSPLQSDFAVVREPEPTEAVGDDAGELPRAVLRSTEASARSTKIVMTFTWIMLAVLALICAVGPHIPSGE